MFKFSILLVFILIYCFQSTFSVLGAREYVQTSTLMPLISVQTMDTCILYNCSVTCAHRKYEQLEFNIGQTIAFAHYCPIIEKLHLTHFEFPNATVPNRFLGRFQNRVRALVLTASNISHIEEAAFANGVFEQITLEDLKLNELHSSYFKDISAVFESLTIKQYGNNITLKIQTDFLKLIQSQLKVLRLQVQAKSFNSIFLEGDFSNLTSLDLSQNQLANRLQPNTFMKFCAIKYLNLSNCKISYLPSHIFSYIMDTLVYLDLSRNRLTQLWPIMFGFHQIPSMLTINAQFNEWSCTCKLYTVMMELFPQIDEIFCQDIDKNNEHRAVDISLCFEKEILATTSMFNTIPATTTESAKDIVVESEKEIVDFCQIILNSQERMLSRKLSILGANNVDAFIKFLEMMMPTNYGIVYFNQASITYYTFGNSSKENEYLEQLNAGILLSNNLTQNMPYTACLVSNNNLLFNPLNCITLYKRTTPKKNYGDSWLTKNHKMLAISILLCSIIAFIFMGFIIVYFIIRRKPSLIKGSKRIIKSRNHQNIVVLPKRSSKKILEEKELQIAQHKNVTPKIAYNMDAASLKSSDSYMNDNIYELIPAYLKLCENPIKSHTSSLCDAEEHYNWLPAMQQFET